MNPSVTLSMLYLGKISLWDALFYIPAQFIGGAAGVGLSQLMLGPRIWHKSVDYAVTVPGSLGDIGAFVCEFGISCLLLTIVLKVAHTRYASLTPFVAGTLVATYITFEAPYSGMSMNPARTVASAVWANEWPAMWVYFLAPVLGMMTGALIHRKILRTV